jgi:aspartate carbamoyltransferase regulatory subunit
MKSTLAVAAIEYGTVIDHIHAGCALPIVSILKLAEQQSRMTLGLNLPSVRHGLKDIIKIDARLLTLEEVHKIALFAAGATINLIRDYGVFEKTLAHFPDTVKGILRCPNLNCVSRTQDICSHFTVEEYRHQVCLVCYYCERSFLRSEINEYEL